MKILVTGGCGFIGSNFIRYLLQRCNGYEVVNLDALTYAGNPENLSSVQNDPAYRFVHGDICDPRRVEEALGHGVDAVVHFAAESHVDRSIQGAQEFVRTNILGTQVLLEAARQSGIGRFLHVSTDEVYGSLGPKGVFTENSPLEPNSPYSASKAAADLLVRSYVRTYAFPAVITRASNNYGPYQFPEKAIPLFITNAMEGRKLPLYGDGQNVRDWLFVEEHCEALERVLRSGREGEAYNIGGSQECANIELARMILRLLDVPEDAIQFVRDRPGHDRRYALSVEKVSKEVGWTPKIELEEGLKRTVEWYRSNESWWRPLKGRTFQEYYRKQYGT